MIIISVAVSDNFPRCSNEKGVFMQLFWQCDQAKSSWNANRCLTKSVLEIDFNLNPRSYLINDMPGKSAEYQLR